MVQYKQIQLKTLKRISKLLEKRGVDLVNAQPGDIHIKVEGKNCIKDFVIEKFDDKKVSFAFYGKQNGDVMRDPELTFIIGEQMKYNSRKGIMEKVVYLIPETFQNDYVGAFDEALRVEGTKFYFSPTRQQGIINLVRDMDNTLSCLEDNF